jgi:adenine deaminase
MDAAVSATCGMEPMIGPGELIRAARGDAPCDLLLANGTVVNVISGEALPTNVAVLGDTIVGLGDYEARRTVDLEGAFVAPGFIDAHVHIESSLLRPRAYARAVVPRGTTTVISDPHEIANVMGLDGIRFMMTDAADGPLDVRVMASSCVPASDLATNGASLSARDLESLVGVPRVPGLAEVMNFPGVVAGDPEVLAKLRAYRGRVIDGHAPGLGGKPLNAYVAAGIASDHECTTADEALEKLRLGMTIYIREATGAKNLAAIAPLVNAANADAFCLCTDDRHPADLMDEGHIDHLVRLAIGLGMDPILALRLATWNAARRFGLLDRGAITPGRRADLVAFDDLRAPRPRLVWSGGCLVARDGAMLEEPSGGFGNVPRHGMNVAWDKVSLRISSLGRRMRVIGIVPGEITTESLVMEASSLDGAAVADPSRDLVKLAVIERHRGTGSVGLGFVKGFGLQRGAFASSVAHDHHNIIVAGVDDASMLTAARRVASLGGGLVVAMEAAVRVEVPLPLAGLMGDSQLGEMRLQLDAANACVQNLGCSMRDPFSTLSFLALEVVPRLKLTDAGLVDVERFACVPLWVDEDPSA